MVIIKISRAIILLQLQSADTVAAATAYTVTASTAADAFSDTVTVAAAAHTVTVTASAAVTAATACDEQLNDESVKWNKARGPSSSYCFPLLVLPAAVTTAVIGALSSLTSHRTKHNIQVNQRRHHLIGMNTSKWNLLQWKIKSSREILIRIRTQYFCQTLRRSGEEGGG